MRLKWEWFLGGKRMFWAMIILFIISIVGFIFTYIIDPTAWWYLNVQDINSEPVKTISEKYVNDLDINIDKKIIYRFVKYKKYEYDENGEEMIILGTFHVWNDIYYIDISVDVQNTSQLDEVVIHETRHMIVEYLREQDIIDITRYTEEIARNDNVYYNRLFDSSVYVLKKENEND